MSKEFKTRLAQSAPLYGVIVTMSLPSVGEMLAECGFDWLWIDMEHAPLSLREVKAIAQATSRSCSSLVRIPINSEEWIKRVLDLGVDGIIVPHVNTVQEAQRVVDASYFPPKGHRSVGVTRASKYGMDSNYKHEANEKRAVFVQIEHKDGVKNAEAIVSLPGIDGIIIGPSDLSGSYGKLGQIHDPEVVAAIERVLEICKQYKKPIGIFAKDADTAKQYLARGFQLVATGIDVFYLCTAAKATVDSLRSADSSVSKFSFNEIY